jgi:glucose/arabinose dehydrogenase
MKKSVISLPLSLILLLMVGCSKKSESQLYIGTTEVDSTTLISGLDTPWEILWGPDNYLWFTERKGTVSRLNPENGQRNVILTIPDVFEYGEGGLLGMALHPDFQNNPAVYLVYNYTSGSLIKERLVKYNWNGSELTNAETLIENISANSYHNGSRLVFGPDGNLYMSTGDAGNTSNSQNMNSLSGKILRINQDGSIPADNPFPASYIWALGLRNTQGLAFSPEGILYGSEHGPDTDDELNLLESGRNYGWPAVAGFCNLPSETTFCNENGVREPLAAWTPTLAVAGLVYYNHTDIPEWQHSLLMTSLKAGKLVSLKLSADGLSVISQDEWFVNHYGRLRDVCISPGGSLYIAVSNRDGRGTPRPGDDRIVEIKAVSSTGVIELPNDKQLMRIIPNPVEQEASVFINEQFKASGYSIYNMMGKLLREGVIETSSFNFQADFLDAGSYILKVTGTSGVISAPFIVR